MGCFDVTCPISGLSVHVGDPIKWSLIMETNEKLLVCYAGDRCQFWFPLLDGKYNDYGSVEWDSIKPTEFWKTIWDAMQLGIKPAKDHRYITAGPEGIFNDLISENRVYDPDRERREAGMFGCLLETKLSIWMCHSWAFKHITNNIKARTDGNKFLKEQADGIIDNPWKMPDLPCASDYKIVGQQGYLNINAKTFLVEVMEAHPEIKPQLGELLLESALFANNLYHIRKAICPMDMVGEQHENYIHLTKWFDLVSKKGKEAKKKRKG